MLVDEYQDTNRLQALVLTRMKPDGRGLTVVGDDAQSIYSFRAAEIRNILDFPGLFTPPAHVITLEKNYRSTQADPECLKRGDLPRGRALYQRPESDRPSAQKPALVRVRDGSDQVAYVVERILESARSGCSSEGAGGSVPSSHHSAELEIELARRNIPFVKFGGLRFLEAAHVKDVLSVLRFAENPGDSVAGFRVLQLLPGIGPTTAGRFSNASLSGLSLVTCIRAVSGPPPQRRRIGPLSWSCSTTCDLPNRVAGRTRAGAGLVRAPP